ncbi:FecR domain-containing protein [Chitinophaga sp. MM2321]|uniref:FecR family protein n=1 Tax=Chitinophaga sp. MM2321 TaxID=3137178 RepID=UPI0032D599B7
MTNERFATLIRLYKAGSLTEEQWEELQQVFSTGEHDEALEEEMARLFDSFGIHETWTPATKQVLWDKVLAASRQGVPATEAVIAPMPRRRWRMAAAAVLVLIVGSAALYSITRINKKNEPAVAIQSARVDVAPGSDKAVLTLADGSTIQLDSTGDRVIGQGAAAIKQQGSRLQYAANGNTTAANSFNTLTTPRSGQFKVILQDGTKVWLNAASSLRYPAVFSGKERKISLQGEAYFDVTQNAERPFVVTVNGMTVKVLGTEFNINSYADEAVMAATLVSGSVQVNSENKKMVLHPGEQLTMNTAGALNIREGVNLEEITAWKDGNFYFDNTALSVILRQFARWYDVDVVYTSPVKDRKFFGVIRRSTSLTGVLKLLEANDIKFRIEGKKLFVQSG